MEQKDYPLNDRHNVPQDVDNPLAVMQPGEKIICEIKRHPIGTIGIYSVAAVALAVLVSAAILIPSYATFLTSQQRLGVVLACILGMVILLIIAYVGLFLYNANRLIVTSDSITEVEQTGLFDRNAHQLSLANLEDVTVSQDGIIPMMFGYGVLHVESAGMGSNFTFNFCPDPNEYARKIIAAHEEFLSNKREEYAEGNQPLVSVKGYQQPGTN